MPTRALEGPRDQVFLRARPDSYHQACQRGAPARARGAADRSGSRNIRRSAARSSSSDGGADLRLLVREPLEQPLDAVVVLVLRPPRLPAPRLGAEVLLGDRDQLLARLLGVPACRAVRSASRPRPCSRGAGARLPRTRRVGAPLGSPAAPPACASAAFGVGGLAAAPAGADRRGSTSTPCFSSTLTGLACGGLPAAAPARRPPRARTAAAGAAASAGRRPPGGRPPAGPRGRCRAGTARPAAPTPRPARRARAARRTSICSAPFFTPTGTARACSDQPPSSSSAVPSGLTHLTGFSHSAGSGIGRPVADAQLVPQQRLVEGVGLQQRGVERAAVDRLPRDRRAHRVGGDASRVHQPIGEPRRHRPDHLADRRPQPSSMIT